MTSRRIWLVCVVLSIAVLFVLMITPSFFPARKTALLNACINNLREIQMAKDKWAEENHKLPTDIPPEKDLYGSTGTNGFLRNPICPAGGKYTIGAVGEKPTCSLSDERHHLK